MGAVAMVSFRDGRRWMRVTHHEHEIWGEEEGGGPVLQVVFRE